MDGTQPPQQSKNSPKDDFSAGQLVGMLVLLKFLETHENITQTGLDNLKNITALQLEDFFEIPSEDIHLFIENLVKEINPI